MLPESDLDRLTISTIRTLALDAVEAAGSGHPGTPMAMAPAAHCRGTGTSASIRLMVALVLSRQPLPTIDRTRFAAATGLARGAYVLADAPAGRPDVLLLATGSEVALCLEAREQLAGEGLQAHVVSMPSWELFERQSLEYRREVLPPAVTARVAVEQASSFGWERYVGADGALVGMHTFGASAPLKALQQKYGFTPARLVEEARLQVARVRRDRTPRPARGRAGTPRAGRAAARRITQSDRT